MKHTYLIGEIGQNHNGSVDIAKLIVDGAAREVTEELFGIKLKGMDAVKLTKRDLQYELSDSQMNRPTTIPTPSEKPMASTAHSPRIIRRAAFRSIQICQITRPRFCRNPLCSGLPLPTKTLYTRLP